MKPSKLLIAAIAGCAVIAALAGFADQSSSQVATAALPLVPVLVSSPGSSAQRNFPSLAGATGWLNSAPLTPESLRGKVVLVDFWTFTCINWRRQVPYVRAWAEKYKDQGLVVIGVHTPEFEFEMDEANVRRAAKDDPGQLSDRDRQRSQDLARIREPVLAGSLLHRRDGEGQAPPIRRRRLRGIGKGHPAPADRSRRHDQPALTWSRPSRAARRPPRTFKTSSPPRTTSDTEGLRTSTLLAGSLPMSRGFTPSLPVFARITGASPASGPSKDTLHCSTSGRDALPMGFTRGICIW